MNPSSYRIGNGVFCKKKEDKKSEEKQILPDFTYLSPWFGWRNTAFSIGIDSTKECYICCLTCCNKDDHNSLSIEEQKKHILWCNKIGVIDDTEGGKIILGWTPSNSVSRWLTLERTKSGVIFGSGYMSSSFYDNTATNYLFIPQGVLEFDKLAPLFRCESPAKEDSDSKESTDLVRPSELVAESS